MPRGFCFPSPAPTNDTEAFRRFHLSLLQAPKTPWPHLVDPEFPNYAWTQPYTRTWYVPTALPDQFFNHLLQRTLPLPYWVMVHHEMFHLLVDYSPAKVWARSVGGGIISWLADLFEQTEESWSPESERLWSSASNLNLWLDHIGERILLAEELLATAFSFVAVERNLDDLPHTIRKKRELSRLESDWVARQAALMGKVFTDFYYGDSHPGSGGFRHFARQLFFQLPEHIWKARGRVTIFLEPARSLRASGLEMPDSRTRCDQLLSHLATGGGIATALDWIEEEIRHEDYNADYANNEILEGYRYSDIFDEEAAVGFGFEFRTVMKRLARTYQHIFTSAGARSTTEPAMTYLWPVERHDQWFLYPFTTGSFDETYLGSLFLEAFRQQLASGTGFRCPLLGLSSGEHCLCSTEPLVKQRLQRLVRWAKEGHFGEGDWSEFPAPCGPGYI